MQEWQRANSGDAEIVQRCKAAVCAAAGAAKVILYGSRARAEQPWDSDMDLLVLLPGSPTEATEKRVREVLFEIELDVEVVISPIIMTEADFHPEGDEWSIPWSRNVSREGILI